MDHLKQYFEKGERDTIRFLKKENFYDKEPEDQEPGDNGILHVRERGPVDIENSTQSQENRGPNQGENSEENRVPDQGENSEEDREAQPEQSDSKGKTSRSNLNVNNHNNRTSTYSLSSTSSVCYESNV